MQALDTPGIGRMMRDMTLPRLIGMVWLAFAAHVTPLVHALAAPCDHHANVIEHAADGDPHHTDRERHAGHDHPMNDQAEKAAGGHLAPDDTTARPHCCDGADACAGFCCGASGTAALQPEPLNALAARSSRLASNRTSPYRQTAGHYLLPLRPPA